MLMEPQLSVIIASFNAEKTITACLESLENQTIDKYFEIIIVDSSSDGTATLVEKEFPEIRLYRFSERKFCGDARNFGISVAKGEIIAFIDADCRSDRNWVVGILKAHQSPNLAIGGAIANGNPDCYIGWAAYFCEFSHWMPNRHAGWLKDIAGANMSYKKRVFREYGLFLEKTYCSDTEFHWRLEQNGHRLRFMPSILVSHQNINKFGKFLKHEFVHGRFFAQVRIQGQNFSNMQRWAYIVFSFLIPVRLFLRIVLNNIKNRIYFYHFMKSVPLLILGLISWSLGECVGYIGGRKCN
ncbi:MAG: glycosyltransferase [Planctomycetes bacterium]|nr:glycosyltransferase [Planctomycetota bacterium]